ncbi:mrna turnover protein 4 homolog [Nannochloropsis oceanica]
MPKSRRDKKVSLTKTTSKGREQKAGTIAKLREALDSFSSLYVFSFEHMRSAKFKDVRIEWRDSRFFMGKNKVMQKALGMHPEDEFRDNLRFLSKRLSGQVGLLATNRSRKDVLAYFHDFKVQDFAKSGAVADKDLTLQVADDPLHYFPASMFQLFRKLGLNLEIKDGKLVLLEAFVVCTKGKPITPEQAKLMTHLDLPLVDFQLGLVCCWSDGEFEELK